jgi:hypothetical protein
MPPPTRLPQPTEEQGDPGLSRIAHWKRHDAISTSSTSTQSAGCALLCMLRMIAGKPRSGPTRSASPQIPMQSLSYDSLRALPVSRTQLMRPSLSSPPPHRFTLHPCFVADQWVCGRCCGLVSGLLQGPRCDPRGAGHVRRRMPGADDTPRCVWRHQL